MNLETKITIYKFTPQVFTLTPDSTIIFVVQGMFYPKGFLLLCINYGGLQ